MSTAICKLTGESVSGIVRFHQPTHGGQVTIDVQLCGLTPGQHGFHIHEFGDTTNGCTSTGAHFNPDQQSHGGPCDSVRHVGDLGNVSADSGGNVDCQLTDTVISLNGRNSIVGRALVVHADPDDLGTGGFTDSKTTGHAGARVACGIIGLSH